MMFRVVPFYWSFCSFFSSLRHTLCDFILLRASRFPLDMRGERFAKDRLLPRTFVSNPKICSKRRFEASSVCLQQFVSMSHRLIHPTREPCNRHSTPSEKTLAYIRSHIEDCHGDVEHFVACSWEKLRAGHGHAGSVLHRWQIHFRLILPDSVGAAFNGLHRSNWHRTSDIGSRAGGLSGRVSFISQARLLLGVGVASLQTLVLRCKRWLFFVWLILDFFFFQSGWHDTRREQTVQLLWSVDLRRRREEL